MAGPALGVWLATAWDTGWALFAVRDGRRRGRLRAVVRQPGHQGRRPTCPIRLATARPWRPARRVRPSRRRCPGRGAASSPLRVAAVYLAAACSTLVLSGTDVAIVAALRSFDATASIGWILALWGAGSLVGGLVYGAWHRSFSVFWLLGGLAATTAPVALAVGVPSFAVLITLSGVLCAPTITATVEQLSRRRARALPRRDDGLARVGHDGRLGGRCPGRRVRHRPRRLAVGLPRRLGGRRRGCRPRSARRRRGRALALRRATADRAARTAPPLPAATQPVRRFGARRAGC